MTTRSILQGDREATTVLLDDNAFDVLDDRGHEADDLCVIYLGHLVQRLPRLHRLDDLTDGSVANATADHGWHRSAISAQQREASVAASSLAAQRRDRLTGVGRRTRLAVRAASEAVAKAQALSPGRRRLGRARSLAAIAFRCIGSLAAKSAGQPAGPATQRVG
ncbi:hypothetical protein [Paractinoplanes globisporus]|uniref:Uncharacterized protein n=1 Tax=Paractinoplanes globisporus TaxID=113565 RepID=A0ABW6WCH0_9ACTN